ncbi:MAG TPA: zf-TFIIB domain-containing protein [Gemmatimonadales bacterium]|nr:zf-TFIIB domain-containing protein [Gemmatimonadales bacterium]
MPTNKPSKSEEEYFAKEQGELLKAQRLRAKAAAEAATRELHFMKCPKDGHDLVNERFHGVTVDRCTHCHGIFLDADEIDAVVAHEDPTLLGRVVRDLSKVFGAPRAETK